jgi:hypothetical protein
LIDAALEFSGWKMAAGVNFTGKLRTQTCPSRCSRRAAVVGTSPAFCSSYSGYKRAVIRRLCGQGELLTLTPLGVGRSGFTGGDRRPSF